ncbi:MAG: hypothetical protein ACLRSD_08795 [Oscillibacter sp.]
MKKHPGKGTGQVRRHCRGCARWWRTRRLGAWASASHKNLSQRDDGRYQLRRDDRAAGRPSSSKRASRRRKGYEVDCVPARRHGSATLFRLDEMPEYVAAFDGLAKHIYNVCGCNDSFLTAGAKYLRALFKPQDAAQVVDAAYSPDLMENLVDTVCGSISCDPVEFAINVTEDGKVSVTKPQDGRATTDTAKTRSWRIPKLARI